MADALARGRLAYERQSWAEAQDRLSAADGAAPLDPDDLERLAVASYLTGHADAAIDVWSRAHRAWIRDGEPPRAARCGFWLAFALLNAGELARGAGWTMRALRLVQGSDGAERGRLGYCRALHAVFDGDLAAARAGFAEAVEVGTRVDDPELVALAQVGLARCLIYLDQVTEATALFDEAMVAVAARELSPIVVGDLCCTVIQGCQEILDLRRAKEWTSSLSTWCDSQPELVLYRGQCLIHRAELMLLHGAWADSVAEAQLACDRLARPTSQPAIGAARYLQGELHRLRGELAAADEAYREANRWGHEPQPGLALLRLAQGEVRAACATIRRVLDEAGTPAGRSPLLAACAELMLAAGDVAAARGAADELRRLAAAWRSPFLDAQAAHVTGAVLLAEGDPRAALGELRHAWVGWRDLDAPYEAARVRVLIGRACRELGDDDGASMELDAARSAFERLGAALDMARVDELSGTAPTAARCGLTPRELEVLGLVATGRTNRAIASELVISERTVATHVSSILAKLGVSSRAGATAYAYEHGLAR